METGTKTICGVTISLHWFEYVHGLILLDKSNEAVRKLMNQYGLNKQQAEEIVYEIIGM